MKRVNPTDALVKSTFCKIRQVPKIDEKSSSVCDWFSDATAADFAASRSISAVVSPESSGFCLNVEITRQVNRLV